MRAERGQATVEFAVVLPILLAVVTMIVQFGITYNRYLTLTDAVRAGARIAAVSRSAADPTGSAQQAVITAGTGLHLTTGQVAVTPGASGWTAGGSVTVQAQTPYSISIFGLSLMSGQLTSSTTERIE